jgi:3-hydroxyisobutyrate dehydrogenase-like beta-hydroxyacid dehydrogenase
LSKQTIGFIGVGLMGHGMAKNIVEKGYPLIVMGHRNRAPVDDLVARGASEAKTARELAAASDIVHICVTGSPQVEGLIRGQDGIIASGKKGLVVIDCSTADPVSTLALATELKAAGMAMVDAPLSRTPKEAEEGTLDCMVGAAPDVFEKVRPVIACWSTNINHLGPLGLGHKMKLINNFVAMGYAALYAEALALAQKSGLTVEQFHAVLGSSRMRNGFYDTFMQWTLKGDPNAHKFTITNAHKDMRYLASMANAAGGVNHMQSVVKNFFAGMEASGGGARHVPMLADYLLELNGLTPRPREQSKA